MHILLLVTDDLLASTEWGSMAIDMIFTIILHGSYVTELGFKFVTTNL